MNLEIPFYKNKLPIVDENVLVIFNEYKETHIEASLVEYPEINGLMIYEDATRRKKVYDWKKEVPLNKQMVAKVEEIFDDKYVKLSKAYFDHRKDPEELTRELMKPFNDNKILLNIIKKFCYNKININDFWENIIYDIIQEKQEEDLNSSLLDYFLENLIKIKEKIKEKYNSEVDELDKLIDNKNYKLETKISLISKNNINDIIELFESINRDENIQIKYLTTPYYIITSLSNNNISEEDHEKLVNKIRILSEEKNIIYNLEYLAKKI
jgi:hypothetical protein